MYKGLFRTLLVLVGLLSGSLHAKPVAMEVELPVLGVTEGCPIPGYILVTDDGTPSADMEFTYEGLKLDAELFASVNKTLVEQKESGELKKDVRLLTYTFFLPGKKAGDYVLSPIELTAQEVAFKSQSLPIRVLKVEKSDNLVLRAYIDGRQPLFPGQTASLVYEVWFKEGMEPVYEYLPLLKAEGLHKIGAVKVEKEIQGTWHVQKYTQQVEAIDAGVLSFDKSYIDCVPFRNTDKGERIYSEVAVRAECEPMSVMVASLPQEKPASFNGAIGQFNIEVKTEVSHYMPGQKIPLTIAIEGEGDLDTVKLPELIAQSGFAKSFNVILKEMPKYEENKKIFHLELFPINASLAFVPSVEFAFFNPETNSYETVQSAPIALYAPDLKKYENIAQIQEGQGSSTAPVNHAR